MELQAIPQSYGAYKFRSRLEARWAIFFDRLGVQYAYEEQGYVVSGGGYLPDFRLVKNDVFVEVKPEDGGSPPQKLYLAGKMNGWREKLQLRGHFTTGPDERDSGFGLHSSEFGQDGPGRVVRNCFGDIRDCSSIFAWLDSLDSYGTLVEIGYADGLQRGVFTAVHESLFELLKERSHPYRSKHGIEKTHDLWFIESLSDQFMFAPDAQTAFDKWFEDLNEEERKCADISSGGKRMFLVRGDPMANKPVYQFDAGHATIRAGAILCLSYAMGLLPGGYETQINAAAHFARHFRFDPGHTPRVKPAPPPEPTALGA